MNKKNKLQVISLFLLLLFISCSSEKQITPETALQAYLQTDDNLFRWELSDSTVSGNLTTYQLLVTSQKWREYTWRHQVTVIVPEELEFDGALLFISGGTNKDELPNWRKPDNSISGMLEMVARQNKAVVAVVFQVPNQPLYGRLTEDELISFTLHNYKHDRDFTWPLLFPMVKSAVKAMDAVQAFSLEKLDHQINRFVLSGESKRGWTTWLAGASDSRVEAIAPMVIDMLNMPKSISYHLEAWGDYSIQIEDYVKLGIAQEVDTPLGQELAAMIDPFSYRAALTIPKFIFNATNDEYWPVDAIKHYLDDIPGENYLHYVPNAGHSLGDKRQSTQALSAFFGETLQKNGYPECSWEIEENGREITLKVKATEDKLAGALLWLAVSEDRDFRDNEFSSTSIEQVTPGEIVYTVSFPETGFIAFYIDLIYPSPGGELYTKSTRVIVSGENGIL